MKKLLFSAAVCSLFMISCNNEMENDLAKVDGKITTKAFVNDADFQIVNYNGENSNGSPRYGLGGTLEVGTNEIPFKGYTTVSLREG